MKIAVFCSARTDIDRAWVDDAVRLGSWIGSNSHTLIFGGVASGLMKKVATATRMAGGRTVGIVPVKRLLDEDPDNTLNLRVADLNARKEAFLQLSDVFVALPGGYGTLDEIVSTVTSLRFSENPRRVIILNSDGIYDPLRLQYYRMIEHGLLEPALLDSMIFVDSLDTLINQLSDNNG